MFSKSSSVHFLCLFEWKPPDPFEKILILISLRDLHSNNFRLSVRYYEFLNNIIWSSLYVFETFEIYLATLFKAVWHDIIVFLGAVVRTTICSLTKVHLIYAHFAEVVKYCHLASHWSHPVSYKFPQTWLTVLVIFLAKIKALLLVSNPCHTSFELQNVAERLNSGFMFIL